MSVREFMNNNPAVITLGAVVVLVVCLGAIMCQLRPGGSGTSGPIDVYYYDLNENALFTAAHTDYPPIQAPSDEDGQFNGVRAMVFSCTNCKDQGTHFIGYLERYTEEAKAKLENIANSGEMLEEMYELEEARELREEDGDRWVSANTEAGQVIYENVRSRCDPSERPQQCFPGR